MINTKPGKHVEWYLEKNPHAPQENAIGFALFQIEMEMLTRYVHRSMLPNIVKRHRENPNLTEQQRQNALDRDLDGVLDSIRADTECYEFLMEHAQHKSNAQYLLGREEYEWRIRTRSKLGTGPAFYPVHEIETKQAQRA
jgi:hypothetical protein